MPPIASSAPTPLFETMEQRALLDGSPFPALSALEDPNDPVVRLETRYGDVDIELFAADAPTATASVLSLIRQGAYAGTFASNLESASRLRTGVFSFSDSDGLSRRNTLVNIDDASGHANTDMTVSLPIDNSGSTPRSSGELVFNLSDNTATTTYLAIGKVIQGWSVIMTIAGLPTLDLTGFFPGNPEAASLTSVPVTSNNPPPTSVTESLLVQTGDLQIVKPQNVQAFYTERLYFPEGYSWERTFEAIELLNPGTSTSSYQVLARYERGSRDQVVGTGDLSGDRRATVVVSPGFGQPSSTVRNNEPYAYELWSTTPIAASFRHKDFKTGVGESFFRPASLPDAGAMREWSFFQSGLGENAGRAFLVWQNLTGTDATVTVTFYFEDAAPVTVNYPLEAHRRGGVNLVELGNLSGFVGARVTADQNIVASLTRYDQRSGGNNGDEGGVAVLGTPGGGATAGITPGARRGVQDPLTVLNTGNTDANITFFVTEEGSATPVQRTATVPAGRVLVLSGTNNPATAAGHGQYFSIRYDSDVPVTVGFVTTAFRGTGTPAAIFAASTTHFADARVFTAPSGSPFGQQDVSLFNPLGQAANVRLVFRFDDADAFTTDAFTVNAGEAVHKRINSYASALAQFLNGLGRLQHNPYSVTVVSDVPIVAQTSQLNSDGRTELGMTLDTWTSIASLFP